MTVQSLPEARDLSHHLNDLARNRFPSPLKDIFRQMQRPGIISMAGGLPHPSLFPFVDASVSVYPPNGDLSGPIPPASDRMTLNFQKYPSSKGTVDLSTILQYGSCEGLFPLREWVRKYTLDVYQPAYSNFEILLHEGNTSAWTKVVRLLCEPGDMILCEEFTFPSAMAVWVPLGCKAVPIKLDGQGMRADHLEEVLANWETSHPGLKRPHVMYVVPVGSNPTGSTMQAERRKAIYEICARYDIIIAEDDPYTTLQFPEFDLSAPAAEVVHQSGEDFAKSLVPSFLHYDRDGRVIRLESFSKVISPGARLGYFVCNPLFAERLLRATEVESQTPSGWSQGIIYSLLETWGQAGYLSWLSRLRDVYQSRRDGLCAALAHSFTALPARDYAAGVEGAEGIALYHTGTDPKSIKPDQRPIATFVPPTGGMFLWLSFSLSLAPRFRELVAQGVEDPEKQFMDEFWQALAENLVLLTPGSYYVPWEGKDKITTGARGAAREIGYLRFAFSYEDPEVMAEGIKRMQQVVSKMFD
ncbi:PLP-dependent transferase [Rhodotorula sp. JG-1b]|nr:PLP-dependent transferase [Rhodotorula sp. JG-1b]